MHRVYIWGPALYFSQGLMGSMCVCVCVCVCTSVCAHVFTSHAVSGVRTGCLLSIIWTNRFILVSVHNFTTDLALWWFHLMEGTFLNKTPTFFGSLLFLPHFLVLSYFLNSERFCKPILNNIFGKFPRDKTCFRTLFPSLGFFFSLVFKWEFFLSSLYSDSFMKHIFSMTFRLF